MHLPNFWRSSGVALLLMVSPLAAQEQAGVPAAEGDAAAPKSFLLKADKVIVRPGKVLEPGSVLIQGGKILAVGQDLEAPEGAEVLQGKVICPSFLDPWSSLGLTRQDLLDRSAGAPVQSIDGFDPANTLGPVREAVHAGVLHARVQVGASVAIGGQSAVVSLTETGSPLQSSGGVGVNLNLGQDPIARIEGVDRLVGNIQSGLKYAQDQAEYKSKLAEWEAEIAKLEEKLDKGFKKAKKDRDKKVKEAKEKGKDFKDKSHKDPKAPRAPKYNAVKDVFARVATGETPLVVQADRHAVLRELLRAIEPFDRLRLIIAGGTEALPVAEELAKRRIPVIVYPNPEGASGSSVRRGRGLALAGELDEAGVSVLIGSGGTTAARDLPLLAALSVGHGLDADKALHAITLGAARAFDAADRFGSVQRGRSADLLILDGDPLSSSTRVLFALSAGRVVVAPKE